MVSVLEAVTESGNTKITPMTGITSMIIKIIPLPIATPLFFFFYLTLSR